MRGTTFAVFAVLIALLYLSPALLAARAADAGEYRIEVDVANQITTVYRTSDGSIARQMICSTGKGDSTPRGVFNLQKSRSTDRAEWYFIGKYQCYVKYPTRISGSILFHSLPYSSCDLASVDAEAAAQLGCKASHGCIRLRWEDARWIAKNCPDGTETRIFTGAQDQQALRELLLAHSFIGSMRYDQFVAAIDGEEQAPLVRGGTGEAVRALQRDLIALGFYRGRPSGEYDIATVVAVMRFQSAAGLTATGAATPALIGRIVIEAREKQRAEAR